MIPEVVQGLFLLLSVPCISMIVCAVCNIVDPEIGWPWQEHVDKVDALAEELGKKIERVPAHYEVKEREG